MQVHTHQLRSLKNQRDQIVDSRNEAMRNAMIGATRRTSPEDVIARRNEEAQREREGKEYAMLERAYAERRERLDAKRRRTEERRRAGSHSTTLGGGKKSGKKKGGGRGPGGRKEENSRAVDNAADLDPDIDPGRRLPVIMAEYDVFLDDPPVLADCTHPNDGQDALGNGASSAIAELYRAANRAY